MGNRINGKLMGQYIKSLRLKEGKSQLEVAYKLGISEKQLRRYEQEGTDKITVIEDLAYYYKVDVMQIICAGFQMEISSITTTNAC